MALTRLHNGWPSPEVCQWLFQPAGLGMVLFFPLGVVSGGGIGTTFRYSVGVSSSSKGLVKAVAPFH